MTCHELVNQYRTLFKSLPKVETAHTEKGHYYVSPTTHEAYHSVTYYTSFIKDPSIGNYKMNRAIELITKEWNYVRVYKSGDIESIMARAKLAPEDAFTGAGDIGTQTHNWRQGFFQDWISQGRMELTPKEIDDYPIPKNFDSEVISGCRAIKKFLKDTGYIPVACELALVDEELKIGGSVDDLGVFPNGTNPYLGFIDLKTSNQGKKPAYAYQVRGFYQGMIRKTFAIVPKKTMILHTSKKNGSYDLIDLTDMDFLEKDAENLVRLSRSWDKVVEGFKPKIKTI